MTDAPSPATGERPPIGRAAPRRWWADTLFKRLFLLMWLGLVASHLVAYLVTMAVHAPTPPPGPVTGDARPGLPVLPSLPPLGAPRDRAVAERGAPHGLPATALALDYGIRILVIGLVAGFGARWLSTPMARLADASAELGRGLGQAHAPPQLDEVRGTEEVRRTASVFNAMARRLHAQFGAQALLMASISHDLRTPLARLRLRLESLAPADRAARAVDDVREMDALIGSILAATREQQTLGAPRPVDLVALLQALVDDRLEHGEPVRFVPAPGPAGRAAAWVVHAAPDALARIFGNLVGNALRHGGSATVSLHGDERWIEARVDDTGPGIPAEHLDDVFQPFFRVDPARGRDGVRPAGSGLGLYIARDLTERCGGRLTLANRPTGGLRAAVRFPRADDRRPSDR